jgi:hypothetical protein
VGKFGNSGPPESGFECRSLIFYAFVHGFVWSGNSLPFSKSEVKCSVPFHIHSYNNDFNSFDKLFK